MNNQNQPYTQKILEVCQDNQANLRKKQKVVQDRTKCWEIELFFSNNFSISQGTKTPCPR